jgi:hypothetical protein
MYKDATQFFSQDTAVTIANIVPTMDRIDTMLSSSGRTPLAPGVKHALTFARQSMDKYYSKTNLSNVYRIAMGMFIARICSILTDKAIVHTVLHPQLKLKYFQQHGWEKDWVKTAEGIIRDEFSKYLTRSQRVSTSESTPLTVRHFSSTVLFIAYLSGLRATQSLKTSQTSRWTISRR